MATASIGPRMKHRRLAVMLASPLVLAGLLGGPAAGSRVPTANPIQIENARPGATGWDAPAAPSGTVEAYASEVSVAPGQSIHLHVSTAPAEDYRVEIYRLGWYTGSGGRLMRCVPSCQGLAAGRPQIVPEPDPATGELRLTWPVSHVIPVPKTWVSGYYLLDVRLLSGPDQSKARRVPIIVREGAGRRSAVLAQASVNTWQAYNAWGGVSLYSSYNSPNTNRVSFDRPYDTVHQGPSDWELSAVRFLERRGYDVSYTTDVDVDRNPAELQRHRLVGVLGHGEYWTGLMRDAFDRARDAGTNLAFLGANNAYWQIRYENDRRTIVEYRDPNRDPEPDPSRKTTLFRELAPPRSECELLGVEYGQIGDSHDYSVAPGSLADPWFAGTGYKAGDTLHGLVGYEWDGVRPGCAVPRLTVFFHAEVEKGQPQVLGERWNADAVRYTAPSGARIFSAGSLQFAWGLDPTAERYDPRLERFMRNGMADLLQPAPPRRARARLLRSGVVRISVPRPLDHRVIGVALARLGRSGVPGVKPSRLQVSRCFSVLDRPGRGVFRYAVSYADGWGISKAVKTSAVPVPRGARAGPLVCAGR